MGKKTILLAPPRGMRDFYPEQMPLRNHIFNAWKSAASIFGFEQYDACVVENLSLLKRKAGEEIVDQIYTFQDKKGRDLALRPEMTPTLARMIANRQSSLELPLKWSTIAQCFRYERMTRGRKREHYQWNMDIVGEKSPAAEAEIIAAAVRSMEFMGLEKSDISIRVNNRALLADLFKHLEIAPKNHQHIFLALDKKGKVPDDLLVEQMENAGLPKAQIKSAFDILRLNSIDEASDSLDSASPSLKNMKDFFAIIKNYGLEDCVKFDISVVRGLAYYTGIVFEAFDVNRQFRAIFGGGRYDNLLRDIGGRELTGVGLGFGDVVISELITSKGLHHNLTGPDYFIGFMQPEQQQCAIKVSSDLRKEGKKVNLELSPEKPSKFFARADKSVAANAIYIGPDDIEKGELRIKNLSAHTETKRTI